MPFPPFRLLRRPRRVPMLLELLPFRLQRFVAGFAEPAPMSAGVLERPLATMKRLLKPLDSDSYLLGLSGAVVHPHGYFRRPRGSRPAGANSHGFAKDLNFHIVVLHLHLLTPPFRYHLFGHHLRPVLGRNKDPSAKAVAHGEPKIDGLVIPRVPQTLNQ